MQIYIMLDESFTVKFKTECNNYSTMLNGSGNITCVKKSVECPKDHPQVYHIKVNTCSDIENLCREVVNQKVHMNNKQFTYCVTTMLMIRPTASVSG